MIKMPVWNPRTRQEILGTHYYLHSFWNKTQKGIKIKNWPPSKIWVYHEHIVKLMLKKGYKHNSPLKVSQKNKKKGYKIMKEFENMTETAELRALSKHSLEHPLTDKQYSRMMQLKKKVIGQ